MRGPPNAPISFFGAVPVRSHIEVFPSERGKVYRVTKAFTVHQNTINKSLTIPLGFEHDRYTFAPDLPDEKPAVAHDRAYGCHKWDDGTKMKRADADALLLQLMLQSRDPMTRSNAQLYYKWVRRCGWGPWLMGSFRIRST